MQSLVFLLNFFSRFFYLILQFSETGQWTRTNIGGKDDPYLEGIAPDTGKPITALYMGIAAKFQQDPLRGFIGKSSIGLPYLVCLGMFIIRCSMRMK